jgi:hypothetical protein
MKESYRLRVSSRLGADAATVWAHAASMAGVNAELAPLRMSAPGQGRIEEVPLGVVAFRSLITLFGVVPIDLHSLRLVEVIPGRGFHEDSRSLLEARWVHKRQVEPDGAGCLVTDEVTFQPRLFGGLIRRMVAGAFARRHRYLRRHFRGVDAEPLVQAEPVSGAGARRARPF